MNDNIDDLSKFLGADEKPEIEYNMHTKCTDVDCKTIGTDVPIVSEKDVPIKVNPYVYSIKSWVEHGVNAFYFDWMLYHHFRNRKISVSVTLPKEQIKKIIDDFKDAHSLSIKDSPFEINYSKLKIGNTEIQFIEDDEYGKVR